MRRMAALRAAGRLPYLGAFTYAAGSMKKSEPKPVVVPKKLSEWMDANPQWAKEYVCMEVNIGEMLNAFFSRLPAPPAVIEQAVKHALLVFLAKRRQRDAVKGVRAKRGQYLRLMAMTVPTSAENSRDNLETTGAPQISP